MTPEQIIDELLLREGGYVNHPDDKGGPTNYGITQRVLAAYRGRPVTIADVRALEQPEAREIYHRRYIVDPRFDRVAAIAPLVGAECVDTGVNMGVTTAARFLQLALNVLNVRGELYPELVVDCLVGSVTLAALRGYMAKRQEAVLWKALNCLQGARYIELCLLNERNESFVYGWLAQRVGFGG